MDPESESEALSIAPDAEEEPEVEPEEEEEECEGEIEVDVEEEDDGGDEREEGDDADEGEEEGEEVDEPEEEEEDDEPDDGDAVQEVRTATVHHLQLLITYSFFCLNSQTSMNSLRPPSPLRQRRRRPPARHDSRSRSNFLLRYKNRLACAVSSIKTKIQTATSSLRKMTMTMNIPVVERGKGHSLHVKPCWPASLGHLMFHWVRLRTFLPGYG
jgi:cobalamin biosynthesis protein CobT